MMSKSCAEREVPIENRSRESERGTIEFFMSFDKIPRKLLSSTLIIEKTCIADFDSL